MKKQDPNHKPLDLEVIKTILNEEPEKRSSIQIQELANELNSISLFKQYQQDGYSDGINFQDDFYLIICVIVQVQCAKYMKYEFVKKGDTVFKIDTVGDKFYLTLKGRVGIYIRLPNAQTQQTEKNEKNEKNDKNDKNVEIQQLTCVKELEAGFSFGELALLNNKPRLASIICHTDCDFMTLDKKSFTLILKQKEEQKLVQEMAFFAKLPFFQGWNYNLIKMVYLNSFRIKYSKNEKVFSEGSEPTNAYIVLEGEFVLQKAFGKDNEDEFGFQKSEIVNNLYKKSQKQTKQIQLAVLVKDEMFGEEDIMNKLQKRTYSAICTTVSGECILIKKRDFEMRILQEEGARLYLEGRLRQKNEYQKEKISQIKGSIADYSSYIFDDRDEIKNKQILSQALTKKDNKIKQSNLIADFQFNDNDNFFNSSPPQTPTDNKNLRSSRSINIRKNSTINSLLNPTNLISPTAYQNLQRASTFSNKSGGERHSLFLKVNGGDKSPKSSDQNKRDEDNPMMLLSSSKIQDSLESHTPWRDKITESYSNKMPETFKNLFNFSSQDEKSENFTPQSSKKSFFDQSSFPSLILQVPPSNINRNDLTQSSASPSLKRQANIFPLQVPSNEFGKKSNDLNNSPSYSLPTQQGLLKRSSFFHNLQPPQLYNRGNKGEQISKDVLDEEELENEIEQEIDNIDEDEDKKGDDTDLQEFNQFFSEQYFTDKQLEMNAFQEPLKLEDLKKSFILPFTADKYYQSRSRSGSNANKESKEQKEKKQSLSSLESNDSLSFEEQRDSLKQDKQENDQNKIEKQEEDKNIAKQSIESYSSLTEKAMESQKLLHERRSSELSDSKQDSLNSFSKREKLKKEMIFQKLLNVKKQFFKESDAEEEEEQMIFLKSFTKVDPNLLLAKKSVEKRVLAQQSFSKNQLFNSSFSPMKGKLPEKQLYKFQQQKDQTSLNLISNPSPQIEGLKSIPYSSNSLSLPYLKSLSSNIKNLQELNNKNSSEMNINNQQDQQIIHSNKQFAPSFLNGLKDSSKRKITLPNFYFNKMYQTAITKNSASRVTQTEETLQSDEYLNSHEVIPKNFSSISLQEANSLTKLITRQSNQRSRNNSDRIKIFTKMKGKKNNHSDYLISPSQRCNQRQLSYSDKSQHDKLLLISRNQKQIENKSVDLRGDCSISNFKISLTQFELDDKFKKIAISKSMEISHKREAKIDKNSFRDNNNYYQKITRNTKINSTLDLKVISQFVPLRKRERSQDSAQIKLEVH